MAEQFSEIETLGRTSFARRHDLVDMLVITKCSQLSEVEGFENIGRSARVKEAWLRCFLVFKKWHCVGRYG